MVQSEIHLIYKNPKKGTIDEKIKAHSTVIPKKKQRVLVYNHNMLCAEYQSSFLAVWSLSPSLDSKDNIRILILGTGAGLLSMFLRKQLGDRLKELVTVDISP